MSLFSVAYGTISMGSGLTKQLLYESIKDHIPSF